MGIESFEMEELMRETCQKIETRGRVGKESNKQLEVNSINSVSLKRSSQFVRSDALSPNSVNRLLIESVELEKINKRKLVKKIPDSNKILSRNNNEINMDSNYTNNMCCKVEKVQETSSDLNAENKQKLQPSKVQSNTDTDKRKSCKSLEMVQPENNFTKLNKQSSLESSLFKKKKMSQAEKHRGWIRMKNVSAVKISIQVWSMAKNEICKKKIMILLFSFPKTCFLFPPNNITQSVYAFIVYMH